MSEMNCMREDVRPRCGVGKELWKRYGEYSKGKGSHERKGQERWGLERRMVVIERCETYLLSVAAPSIIRPSGRLSKAIQICQRYCTGPDDTTRQSV